jgi:hypothetical protein
VRTGVEPLRVLTPMLRHVPSCILGLALASTGPLACKKQAPASEATADTAESPVRPLVAEKLASSSFAVVGEVVSGDRRAMIAWPGLVDGKPSPMVAFAFAHEGESWSPIGERLDLPSRGGDQVLSGALGGDDDQRIVRDCGLPPEKLAAHLKEHGSRFAAALEGGDSDAAVSAFEQMARAFDWEHVATSSMLLDLLLSEAPKTWYCGPKGCTVESDWDGRRRMQTFANADCGEGQVVGRALAPEP